MFADADVPIQLWVCSAIAFALVSGALFVRYVLPHYLAAMGIFLGEWFDGSTTHVRWYQARGLLEAEGTE